MTKHTFKIAAIPADGVGKEVIAAGRRVLDTLAAQTGTMSIDFDYQGVPHTLDPWRAADDRDDSMVYRRVGKSGLIRPAISLGRWYNFGDNSACGDCGSTSPELRPMGQHPTGEVPARGCRRCAKPMTTIWTGWSFARTAKASTPAWVAET